MGDDFEINGNCNQSRWAIIEETSISNLSYEVHPRRLSNVAQNNSNLQPDRVAS